MVAPVDPCRVVDRALLPPPDRQRICYWTSGAGLSASSGTTVLAGEPDWLGAPPSAFGRVDALVPGDEVLTADGSGAVTEWRVVRVVLRAKRDGVDPAAFAGTSGPRHLYLVTGGGRYDAGRHAFLDNVYVLAVPARS